MMINKGLIACSVFAILVGCATTFHPESFDRIQTGMTKSAVIRMLGKPDTVRVDEEIETLRYNYAEGIDSSLMEEDFTDDFSRQYAEKRMNKQISPKPYQIKLKDGKVFAIQHPGIE